MKRESHIICTAFSCHRSIMFRLGARREHVLLHSTLENVAFAHPLKGESISSELIFHQPQERPVKFF